MNKLKVHNTISGQKEDFIPLDAAHIRLYACGPTVYNYAHIGNARMAVVFDLLADVLRSIYPKVTYVSNITDVDDKIIEASRQTGKPISEITEKYAKIYNDDMAYIGVRVPDVQPKATEHIGEMIDLIAALIDKGHAYEGLVDGSDTGRGHVLFHVPSFPAYGELSGRSRDEQIAGARVDVAPYKKDPADFVLWKPSSDDEPGWDSPWGRGRPGWHIECSAMAEKHLGLPFDIHGGGADLKFPHHENEIAQSCCAHGHEHEISGFSKYWIHNGFVTVSGEKMSKSIGNIRLVHHLKENYRGEVLRLTLLSAHYRQPLDWSENTIEQSQSILDRLYSVLHELADVSVSDIDDQSASVPQALMDALLDDLNTPKALAELNILAKSAAKANEQDKQQIKSSLLAAGKLLGILGEDPAEWLGYGQVGDDIDLVSIDQLIAERQRARAEKDFARADEIRDILADKGIVIEDSAEGVKWRKQS